MMTTTLRRWVSGISLLALLVLATAVRAQEESAAASDVPAGLGIGIVFFGVAAVAVVGLVMILNARAENHDRS